jgi:hypothetical protein
MRKLYQNQKNPIQLRGMESYLLYQNKQNGESKSGLHAAFSILSKIHNPKSLLEFKQRRPRAGEQLTRAVRFY